MIKSGPYKDILSFDRELTPEEEQILQSLIDSTYEQFVATVAEGRKLPVEDVKKFADGRIFSGQQALELGVVDKLGTEEDARRWLAEMVNLDPQKTECNTIEEPKPFLQRILSRNLSNTAIGNTLNRVNFELTTNGQPLWLYK